MPSIVDRIVRSANVSRATAYRVLAGADGVSEETRSRVLEAVSAVGEPALRRRRSPSKRLAVWVPGLGELLNRAHHRAVVQALETAATDRNMSLDVINDPVPSDPQDAVATVERLKVRGVLLMSFYSVKHRRAIAEKWPVVLFFEAGHGERLAQMAPDDFAAGFLATRHLIEHGHRRIAVAVGGGRRPVGFSTRFAGGYAQALAEAGLPVEGGLVLRHAANLKFTSGKTSFPPAGSEFLKLKPRPTALIGRHETMVGVMHTLAQAGLRVPEDVSTIGYGPEGENGFAQPAPTRVEYSPQEMAETALGILAAPNPIHGSNIVPVHLEEGDSVKSLSSRRK